MGLATPARPVGKMGKGARSSIDLFRKSAILRAQAARCRVRPHSPRLPTVTAWSKSFNPFWPKSARAIRWYVAGEGTALVLVAAGLCFWGSFLCDYWLEWPRFVRFGLLLAMIGWIGWTLFQKLLGTVVARAARPRAGPGAGTPVSDLGGPPDTTVELAEREPRGAGAGLNSALLGGTIAEVKELASRLKVSEALNHKPLARAAGGAALLVVSVGGFATAFGDHFGPWFRRNVLLARRVVSASHAGRTVRGGRAGRATTAAGRFRAVPASRGGADFTLVAVIPGDGQVPEEVRSDID